MAVIDCCRLMLFLVEWIWTTVVLGIFPDQLTTTEQLTDGSFEGACLFNMNLGQSRCDFGIAWAAIAFFVLTCTIIWYFLEYCTSARFSTHVETIIFTWLTVWWFVGAIALSTTKSPQAPSPANVPVVFAWMLFVLSGISAFIASRSSKFSEYRGTESTDADEESAYE